MDATKTPNRLIAGLRNATVRRLFALLVLSLGAGAFVAEYTRVPDSDLAIGSVATRTIRANANFPFVDWAATLERQRAAEVRVQPCSTLTPRSRARFAGVWRKRSRWRAFASRRSTPPTWPPKDLSLIHI